MIDSGVLGFMKKNSFGKYVAALRIENNQTQMEMAQVLSVSPAFLSRTENGGAAPPFSWIDILSEKYQLSPEEKEELKKIIMDLRSRGKVYIGNLTIDDQNLAKLLISKLSNMPPDKKEQIKKLILE